MGAGSGQLLMGWYFHELYALYGANVVQYIIDIEDVLARIEWVYEVLDDTRGMAQLKELNTSQRLFLFASAFSMFLQQQNGAAMSVAKNELTNEWNLSWIRMRDARIEQDARAGRITDRIVPAQNGLGAELFTRFQPIDGNADNAISSWDSSNPFAPIFTGESFEPDDDWFEGRILIRP